KVENILIHEGEECKLPALRLKQSSPVPKPGAIELSFKGADGAAVVGREVLIAMTPIRDARGTGSLSWLRRLDLANKKPPEQYMTDEAGKVLVADIASGTFDITSKMSNEPLRVLKNIAVKSGETAGVAVN